MLKTIATAVITAALLSTGGAAGATSQAAGQTKDTVRPCRYEDGSGQARCVWDARHMGNGSGQSLLITKGGTDDARYIHISHKRAHRLYSEVQSPR